jgi:hypothetical protein
VERLEKLEEGIVVLAPCGCSRAELLKRLLRPGEQVFARAYVYRESPERKLSFKEKVKEVGQCVEEYGSLEELVGKLKGREGELVAVVPESSYDAIVLKRKLERELPAARVELLYLPELYRGAAEAFSEKVRELAKVVHEGLKKDFEVEASGFSSKLLSERSESELGELERAKEAVLKLSPDRLGLREYLVEAAGKMLIALAAAPFGVAVALAVEQLFKALASLNLHEAVQKLLGKVGGVSAEPAEGFASRVLEGWSRPEARNKVAEGLARLVAAAREAAPHLDREELETVVDQVALEWGMDAPTFKVFVRNLAKMVSGELVTREELRKELEKLVGKELEERLKRLIEDRLREIEKMLEELQDSVKGLKIGVGLFYAHELEKGLLYPNFKVEKGRPVIASREERGRVEAELVTAGPFEKQAEETLSRLEKGFVVLEGPKGIGKSTLATYTVWLALLEGRADAVLQVIELERGESLSLERLAESLKGRRILALYDPSPLPTYYEPGAFAREARKAVKAVEETLQELLKLAESGSRVLVLTVLPSDLYKEALSPELKEKLEPFTMPVNLRDLQFLEEIIKEYSSCTGSFEELAEAIARFEGGYTLVAKYAGLTLRGKGCSVEDARKALEEAKGRPKLFLAHYLWSVILKGSEDFARRVAVPLLLHAAFGPVPEGVTYLTAASRERPWRFLRPEEIEEKRFTLQDLKDEELEPIAKWLSVRHEDLMEEMLRELCGFEGGEARELYAQHLPKLAGYQRGTSSEQGVLEWALNKVVGEARGAGTIKPEEALLLFASERLVAALEAYAPRCWRRLALVAGSALTAHYSIPLKAAESCLLPGETLEPCEADSYLLVGGVIPPLVVEIALQRPGALAHPLARWHGKTAEEIKQLEKTWCSRGDIYLSEVEVLYRLYGLGLALAVAGAAELGESAEAEVALRTAALAVQEVLDVECVTAILNSFRRLGELAPHYYVFLVSEASALTELERRAVREMADFLEGALEKHWGELKGRGWPLVEAVTAYSNLLTKHRAHFLGEEERLRVRMCKLLEGLEGQLRDIAEVYALTPALSQGLKPCSSTDLAGRAEELLKRLEEMEKEEPSRQAAEWAALQEFKPEEFKLLAKGLRGLLTFTLAIYKMKNDDLEAAKKLFERSKEISEELKGWEDYLACRSLAVRCSVLGAGSLEELRERARAFEDLWSKAKEHERPARGYFVNESAALAGYLVFLALERRVGEVSELLKRERRLLSYLPDLGVTVRLLLERLGVRVGKPEAREVATALRNDIPTALRPIFFAALSGAIRGGREAATILQVFREGLGEVVGGLSWGEGSEEREVVERFYRELLDFVDRRGVSAAVQLWAPANSRASFTLMLWALLNGDEELARAQAKLAAILFNEIKLLRRLFREAAEAQGERLELALLKLFYYHI